MARISPEDFAAMARALEERGVTLERLSEASGLHPSSIHMILEGKLLPTLEIRRKLAAALGIDPREVE